MRRTGQVEQRAERRREIAVRRLRGKPRRGAQLRAALPVRDQHVAGHERRVLRDPVHDLGGASRPARLDAARKLVADRERIRDDAGAARDRGLSALRRPDARVVALAHLLGAARVPEDGDEDVHTALRALHVAVEGLPEAGRVVGRDERVDEHDAVLRGDERGADVLLPLLVEGGPAPEAGGDLEHVHGETLKRTDR